MLAKSDDGGGGRRPRHRRRGGARPRTSPDAPAGGGFDAVIERHLLWTLPDPVRRPARLAGGRPGREAGGHRVDVGRRRPPRGAPWARLGPREASARHRPRSPRALSRRGAGRVASRHRHPSPCRRPSWWPRRDGAAPRLVRLRDVEWASTLEQRLPERLLGVDAPLRRRRHLTRFRVGCAAFAGARCQGRVRCGRGGPGRSRGWRGSRDRARS